MSKKCNYFSNMELFITRVHFTGNSSGTLGFSFPWGYRVTSKHAWLHLSMDCQPISRPGFLGEHSRVKCRHALQVSSAWTQAFTVSSLRLAVLLAVPHSIYLSSASPCTLFSFKLGTFGWPFPCEPKYWGPQTAEFETWKEISERTWHYSLSFTV